MEAAFTAIRQDLHSLQHAFAIWQSVKPALDNAFRFAADGTRQEAKEIWDVVETDLKGIYGNRTRKILAMAKKGLALSVFSSAEGHKFRTHRPLSERAVRKFEAHHRIELPDDYRGFLIHVGNGGAGPGYGMFKLGYMDHVGTSERPWTDFVGVLSEPFPHIAPWNDLTGKPVFDESQEEDEEWESEYQRQMDEWENKFYFSRANFNGAFPICHRGCALRNWLVVTGPEAGNVWDDQTADYAGLKPVQHGRKKRVTFLEWYRFWLDDALRQLR